MKTMSCNQIVLRNQEENYIKYLEQCQAHTGPPCAGTTVCILKWSFAIINYTLSFPGKDPGFMKDLKIM